MVEYLRIRASESPSLVLSWISRYHPEVRQLLSSSFMDFFVVVLAVVVAVASDSVGGDWGDPVVGVSAECRLKITFFFTFPLGVGLLPVVKA